MLDQSPNFDYNAGVVSWDDFNFDDLNSHLLGSFHPESVEISAQLPQSSQSSQDQPVEPVDLQRKSDTVLAAVESLWFTRLECDNSVAPNPDKAYLSGTTTPGEEGRPGGCINDIYRQSLANRLRPKWSDDPLPSTEFLVRLYSYGRD
jgi:hypothetical protein